MHRQYCLANVRGDLRQRVRIGADVLDEEELAAVRCVPEVSPADQRQFVDYVIGPGWLADAV